MGCRETDEAIAARNGFMTKEFQGRYGEYRANILSY